MLKIFGKKLDTLDQVEAAIEAAQEKIQKLNAAVDELVTKSTIDDVDAVGTKVSGIESAKRVLEKQIAVLRERKTQLEAIAKQEKMAAAEKDVARLDQEFYTTKTKIKDELERLLGKEIAQEVFRNYRSRIKALREIEFRRDEARRLIPVKPLAALPTLGPKQPVQVVESHVQADA